MVAGVLATAIVIALAPQLVSRICSNAGMLSLARHARMTGDERSAAIGEARAWLECSLRWDPHNASAYRGLGWVDAYEGKWNVTATDWQQAGWTQQDLLVLATGALRSGLPGQAQQYLAVGTFLNGDLDSALLYMQSQVWDVMGRETESARSLETAIVHDTGWGDDTARTRAWLDWAGLLATRHQHSQAEQAAEKALDLCLEAKSNPSECWKSYHMVALERLAQEDYARAVTGLEDAIGRYPSEAWLRVRYGEALYLRTPADFAGAEEQFTMAVTMRNDSSIWNAILQFWSAQRMPDRVADWCARARASGNGQSVDGFCSPR